MIQSLNVITDKWIYISVFLHCKEKYKKDFSSYELKYILIERQSRKFKLKRNKSFKLEDNIKRHAISHLFPADIQKMLLRNL